jgi:hypothetical protein
LVIYVAAQAGWLSSAMSQATVFPIKHFLLQLGIIFEQLHVIQASEALMKMRNRRKSSPAA